ncbi:12662_t:CDS:1 [Funneliformis caledonium]|uniref:12662_t:CDS:1 n=1 Tax=Funneliformis caledonium TaxID=1117310 RepID=A0A9N8V3H4_9GLOM|nr:12662_t:CDS:1 [Funneliformis caledonium]
MKQKNQNTVHYYEDGDILITVQDVTFRIHKNILSIASKVFRDMFTCATSSSEGELPSLTLTDTSSTTFENLLAYLYPHTFTPITWENVTEFCQLADKYEFNMVIEAADNFLKANFQESPLISLVLADRYGFKCVYKESSKLILDNLLQYKGDLPFKKLSSDTRCALMEKYLDFVVAVSSLQDLKHQYDYHHACEKNPNLYTVCLNKQKTCQLYEDFFNGVQLDPTVPPSINLNLFLKYCKKFKKKHALLNQCNIYFIQHYLIGKIVKYLFSGDIKAADTLECEKDKEDAKYYLFIELKNY